MATERKGKYHESAASSERRFKRMIEDKFNGSLEVAEKLLEMASCDAAGNRVVVENRLFDSYAIEINCPEMEMGTKTKLTFLPEGKCFWLEISKSGEIIYGETAIKVREMRLHKNDGTRVVIVRRDNGRKINIHKNGRVGVI
jgi:hypothetical protein